MHQCARRKHAQGASAKKLIDAGAYWVNHRAGKDDSKADLEWLQIPEENQQVEPDEFEVYPENWQALELFRQCASQWRTAGMGTVTGLDYTSVKAVLDIHHPNTNHIELFEQIRLLEQGALTAMHEQREANASH